MTVTNILIGIVIVFLHYIYLTLMHIHLESYAIRHYIEKMDDES